MPNSSAQPLVSIVLPTYNGERFLQESIDSCLNQTLRDFELILVDDGSQNAETLRILASQTDPRVIVDHQKTNLGLPRALNAGFRIARGRYLTWTSDDNHYRPEAIETMVTFLERGETDFVYARATAIDDEGRIIGEIVPRAPENLVLDNCIGPCFLYTREVMEKTGPYDPSMILTEDYDYWIRVFKRFRMMRIDHDLYLYRHHSTTLTSIHGRDRVQEKIDQARRKHFSAWQVLRADGLRAFARDDRREARQALLSSFLHRPLQTDLLRPLAICLLPQWAVRCVVRFKQMLKR